MTLAEPRNDHELAIVRIVDCISLEDRLDPTSITEIVAVLDFMMSKSDSEFLVGYIRWRIENRLRSKPRRRLMAWA
jgi:hypothetical protein